MINNPTTKDIQELLSDIENLSCYKNHVILPDLHLKDKMEAPSSTAISTGEHIVPSLASAAINDGMSVIKLPFRKEEINEEIIKDFFSEINSHASAHKLSMNKYSLTKNELLDVCLNGANAVLGKYRLAPDIINSMENSGRLNNDLTEDDILRLVPNALLSSKFSRAEFGLNFRGNHFLEIQSVEELIKEDYLTKFNIKKGDLTVMTHLGPGPFTGNLMRLYTNRNKISLPHRVLYFLAKTYFHLIESKRKDLKFSEIIKLFFNPDKYQAFSLDTTLGSDFYKLLQIGTNYGYAYQLGTFAAIKDAAELIQNKYSLTKGKTELIWNVSHNSIYFENCDGVEQFVTRHNSVRITENMPTILAGSFDVPSCIGICDKLHKNDLMNTHDHGIGSIIERIKKEEKFKTTNQISKRYFYKRGTKTLTEVKECQVSDFGLIKDVSNHFSSLDVFSPWFYVTPIATLKN